MLQTQRTRALAVASAVALLTAACGAGDKLSGAVDPNPALCPTIEELAPNFLRLLREDRFSGLRSVLEQDLGKPLDAQNPNGPTYLSALLGVLVEVVANVDVPGTRQALLDALRSTEAGPLLSQIVGLLRYLDGQIGCPAGTRCDHYDVLDVLRRLFDSKVCTEAPAKMDSRTVLDFFARIVKHPRLPELLDLFPRLLQNPTFRSVLDSFRFDNCGQASCEQEDGFVALLDILLDNVLVSPLPWATMRDLLRQVRLLTPEVDALFTIAADLLAENPTDPERDVLTPMRAAVRCLRIVDPRDALTRNIYRLLALDDVNLAEVLEGVDRLLDSDPEQRLLQVFGRALDYFRERSLRSFQTLQLVLDVLLAPEQARRFTPSLIAMIEGGVLPELADLLVALTAGCDQLQTP